MTKQKNVLGRGLGALLPDPVENTSVARTGIEHTKLYNFDERIRSARSINDVDVASVSPNPYQPREHFDESSLLELSNSIKELGIIQPITVRRKGEEAYELISGERRLKAAIMAGLRSIPAYVREADTEAMLEMALVENVQREQLNPMEIALGYRRLIDECDLTQEQVATKIGKNRSTVANFLRLLRLPLLIQAGLRDAVLTSGHARALLAIEDEALQKQVLDEIVRNGLSVREVERMVKQLLTPKRAPRVVQKSPVSAESIELTRLADRVRHVLGTKVTIKPSSKGGGGRIELEYYSNDDLQRIIDLLD